MENEKDDGVIFVGTKPFMNYVTGVIMQFTTKNANDVTVKARGKYISRAVDVVEVVRKKFLKDKNLEIKDVKINSEEMENREGRKTNVSTIEITLAKK